jgi:hypothetical protein
VDSHLHRGALGSVLLACTLAARAGAVPATLAPEALRAGQRAVVRTVFVGAGIDTFEAVILGTLDSGRSEGLTILARATSANAVRTGVAQGMSGSPVYVDGKLIGALSSGFPFDHEPIFGITPIGEMLSVLEHPDATSERDPSTGMSGVEKSLLATPARFRELHWAGDDAEPTPGSALVASAARSELPSPLPLPLACGGLNPAAAGIAHDWLAPLGLAAVPGGRSATVAPGPETLEPGSAVAIDVLRGDLLMTAIGTLTWRDGDRILMFGHPLFQTGDARMPLATATIATIVPSDPLSFKLGQRGREVGAILQDRRAAVAGRLGVTAHMLPFRVDVSGLAPRTQRFRFETVEDRMLAPSIVGIAAINSVLESGGTGAGQTLRWTLKLHRRGAPALELSDVIAGDNPVGDLGLGIVAPVRFLFGNPYTRPAFDSIEVAVEAAPRRQSWTLRSARVVEPAVRPGGIVHVACELEAWRGGIDRRTLALTVPREVPEGRYVLWVGGGTELSRYEATRLPGRYRVTSLDDAWERLATARSSDALYAALSARAPEVSADGRDYPELPLFALSLLASEQTTSGGRRGDLAWLDERRQVLQGPLRGELQLTVVVESHGSLAQP